MLEYIYLWINTEKWKRNKIGVFVVMIASNSPAKNAAKVFHVDTAMGLRYAFSNKKSMVLIAGSFAIKTIHLSFYQPIL